MIGSNNKLLAATAGAAAGGGATYDYETSYGTPSYTITSFPSTGSGVSTSGVDLLIAIDANIALTDDGILIELGADGGYATAIGVFNGTIRARSMRASGNDWGAQAGSTQIEVDISYYCGSPATYYFVTDISTYTSKLYVQVGGRGSENELILLGSDTSDGSTNQIYGSNGKGYGQINSNVGDLGTDYEVTFTGTIDEIRYWSEDGTLDVSEFGLDGNGVVLLLNTDSGTSFVDSSPYALTLSARDANVSVSTTQFKYGVSSAYFAAATTGINLPTTSNLTLDGDFTIESWCYKTSSAARVVIGSLYPGVNNQVQFDESTTGTNALGIYHPSTGWKSINTGSSPNNEWFHIAITREGTTLRYYLNGIYKGTHSSSATYNLSGGAIGALAGYWQSGWTGYLDDVRVIKGTALYTTTSSFNVDDGPASSFVITPPGEQIYTTPGTYSWTAPEGVTSVSVVAIGGGGNGYVGGGGGGGLGYKNNIAVVPGNSYTVVVGSGSSGGSSTKVNGGNSYFINTSTVVGYGGTAYVSFSSGGGGTGGSYVGDGGGNGGNGGAREGLGPSPDWGGGGGAGGYAGNGGNGGSGDGGTSIGAAGTGGAAGGGRGGDGTHGAGVGLYGQGINGTGGSYSSALAGGGSDGSDGTGGFGSQAPGIGAGGGGQAGGGGTGAVRIIWPGVSRQFPINNVGVT